MLKTAPPTSIQDRVEHGKAARARFSRSDHAKWSLADRHDDPLRLLAEQATTRAPELTPIRHGRMAVSPFAYFRGAAYPMASDLAGAPRTGLNVQLCGDAHLLNFGGFASPERDLLFDINDFDETHPGPFEWDLKRLAASLEIAARSNNYDERLRREIVARSVHSYREAIRLFAGMRNLDIWYSRLDVAGIVERWGTGASKRMVANFKRLTHQAYSKDPLKAFAKLSHEVDGHPRITSDPPLIVPIEDVFSEIDAHVVEEAIIGALHSYRRTLNGDRRRLLDTYRLAHVARKVVGVGSVGLRAWIVLLIGRDRDDPLFLQVKEAEASVLERFSGASQYTNHGQRVVEGQRLMQAASDIFLGWDRVDAPEGGKRDFYARQLWDWKVSADIDSMLPKGAILYGEICGWTLARAHARSGDAIAIGSYLGSSDTFDRAITEFAVTYADQNKVDHEALVAAIATGRVEALAGV